MSVFYCSPSKFNIFKMHLIEVAGAYASDPSVNMHLKLTNAQSEIGEFARID